MNAAFYCICEDGFVYSPRNPADLPPIVYHIETSFLRETADNTWFTAYVQDKKRQRVPGNLIDWHGIKCRVEEKDGWSYDLEDKKEFGIDGIVLVAHISDIKGKERKILFNNNRHDSQAWKQLMEYLRDVLALGTHRAVKAARALR